MDGPMPSEACPGRPCRQMEHLLGTERSFHWPEVCLVVRTHPVVDWHMDDDMGSLIVDGPWLPAGAPWPHHGLGSHPKKLQGLAMGQHDQQLELVVLLQIRGFFHRKCQSPLGTDRTGVALARSIDLDADGHGVFATCRDQFLYLSIHELYPRFQSRDPCQRNSLSTVCHLCVLLSTTGRGTH